jgi:hypothetical protein
MERIGALLLQELGPWHRHPAAPTPPTRCVAGLFRWRAAGSTCPRGGRHPPAGRRCAFGVREWAWLAVRPQLARQLPEPSRCWPRGRIRSSERLRRFASEALRPRGVWCAHIAELKAAPEAALASLAPLRADPSAYGDRGQLVSTMRKSRPDWVRGLWQPVAARQPWLPPRGASVRGRSAAWK